MPDNFSIMQKPKPHQPLHAPNYLFLRYPGPKFSREDLEILASGKISSRFGDWFKPLDHYERLIRMPQPPLLLTDRVLGIAGAPGSLKHGTIWTETDITKNAWYLHQGRMPAGIMIEAGQSDLLLISWLGFDFYNRSERVYRLLGCELSYHDELPKPDDTLHYDIHIDGHAKQGEIRLFFFHYDCHINGKLRLKVRNGQAGFFTDKELAESGGILWNPHDVKLDNQTPIDPPVVNCGRSHFDTQQLQQFSRGDTFGCFGDGFEKAAAHTRTPCIANDNMRFINRITDFKPQGGPLQRGYMRAEQDIAKEDWFFEGHFKNDPCMPGTLMLEAGLQVMSCYITALGFTLDRDGWRFEPVPDKAYKMQCRGQVIPQSKQVIYEIFVTSIIAEPIPTLYADLLATVDGLKAFHTHIGLQLIPDWPLSSNHPLLKNHIEPKSVAENKGFKFDYASLLACALGKPSTAFGPMYALFDNHRRVARLPGPPYHFMSRITKLNGEMGSFKAGAILECEYDIPNDSWYFQHNSHATMPFCVLLEAALQPCGWLASYLGSTLSSEKDLVFRNLDGTSTLLQSLPPNAGSLRTMVKCTSISQTAGMIIENFEVTCFLEKICVYKMTTVFGFFPLAAFINQPGLPIPDSEKTVLHDHSEFNVDLTTQPATYYTNDLRLPEPTLLMLDRITGFWHDGGEKNLGRMRAEKIVNPNEWFFKAHFFQDPVQPGSLGIEAMIQLLQFYMLHQNMHKDILNPQFEPLALDCPLTWKYRGQVIPTNKIINTVIDITSSEKNERGALTIANASLWVDGKRIYEAKNVGMRIVSGQHQKKTFLRDKKIIDPDKDTWIKDHCPTYLLPALPMMSMVDMAAHAAMQIFPDKKLIAMKNIQVLRWVAVTQPITIHSEVISQSEDSAEITLFLEENHQRIPFAKAKAFVAHDYPIAPQPPVQFKEGEVITDPYLNLFHGAQFQIAKQLRMGTNGSSMLLICETATKAFGYLNQILLDGATHGIPHDDLSRWNAEISTDKVAYPALILEFKCFGPAPSQGIMQCETRFLGFHHNKQFPKFLITLVHENQVWASIELVEALFPKGPLGAVSPDKRRLFLRDKQYVADMALSKLIDGKTHLNVQIIKTTDWLPGSVAALYEVDGDLLTMTRAIAIKEHFARQFKVHPAAISILDNNTIACKTLPSKYYSFKVSQIDEEFVVASASAATCNKVDAAYE